MAMSEDNVNPDSMIRVHFRAQVQYPITQREKETIGLLNSRGYSATQISRITNISRHQVGQALDTKAK